MPLRKRSAVARLAHNPFKTMFAVLAVVLVVLFVGALATGYFNKEPVTFTLKEKESVPVNNGNGGTKNEYRLYTDNGTYVIKDSLVFLRFDSADEYGKLDEGKRYTCQSYGFRLPFFSKFKNLLDCRPA